MLSPNLSTGNLEISLRQTGDNDQMRRLEGVEGSVKMQKGQEKIPKDFFLPLSEVSEISLEAIQALCGNGLPSP